MAYRVLVLDPRARHMTLPVLRKIRELVREGALVVGSKPSDSPSLSDSQAEFQTIADEVWGSGAGDHAYGNGTVYAGRTLADVLRALALRPDFEYTKPSSDAELRFIHRKLDQGDIYWVNNRNGRAQDVDASFRVQGMAAELWHPDSGKIEPASYRIEGGRTVVPLCLDPMDALFVVFRKPAAGQSLTVPAKPLTPIAVLEGAWDVSFQPERGAPPKITLEQLSSWIDNADAGVKYFSGTGTYFKTIQAPADWFSNGASLWLDLGSVKDLADATVNGHALGIAWKTPFRFDVTDVMKPGANTLEIRVTNLWVNRLIGDAQPDVAKKYTYTTQPFYRADSPLRPSGLLGPVRILRSEK
jgi:hypothetical protein